MFEIKLRGKQIDPAQGLTGDDRLQMGREIGAGGEARVAVPVDGGGEGPSDDSATQPTHQEGNR